MKKKERKNSIKDADILPIGAKFTVCTVDTYPDKTAKINTISICKIK